MTEDLPSSQECMEILRKSGCSENVISHCQAVKELAVRMAELSDADKDLVNVAALLHDIGRAKTHGIWHALEGANMVRELGLPESVILIIERHIGAGITLDEAKSLGFPEKDYIPATLEEKIVAHSDNLIVENEKRSVKEVVERFEEKGYHEAAKKILRLHEELSGICGIDLDLI
ncbi:MAG: HDIG domain-containing protein [Thermoplasmata archaeon]|nr:MAG: HDIG domain-containing protein [Thermoplasmata archaeon]